MLFYFWQLIPKPAKLDELQKLYYSFTDKFNKFGVIRLAGDTPEDFRQKANQRFPEQIEQINAIIETYQGLRYGRQNDQHLHLIEQFKQHIKQFKLSSKI